LGRCYGSNSNAADEQTTIFVGTFPLIHLLPPLPPKIEFWSSDPEGYYLEFSGSDVAKTSAAIDKGLTKAGEYEASERSEL